MITLKNILLISSLTVCGTAFSQVIIGDKVGTASNKGSVLLEFANTNNKGIVLPWVRTKPTAPTEGSIILDASDPANARVKFYNGNAAANTSGWTDLSVKGADISALLNTQPDATQVTEKPGAKVIIGSTSSPVNDGVLVLESATKAMVLPIVSDVNNIPSPSPGMIVFVNTEGRERLAVFNGTGWSFWKP